MKKLNKLVLNKAKVMTAPQMKHISGGYDDPKHCVVDGQTVIETICTTDEQCYTYYGEDGVSCE